MNPFEAFRAVKEAQEKKAGFASSFTKKHLGPALAQGAATAVVGAGVAGVGMAASKIYDAMTKRRDFHQMLESNPDLAEHQAANPTQFNQMFSTLRMMNPTFSADPVVAGSYMRRMAESPMTAGSIAVEALGHRDEVKHPAMEMFQRGGLEGAKTTKPTHSLQGLRDDVERGELEGKQRSQTNGLKQQKFPF